jgi:hypothetical protein
MIDFIDERFLSVEIIMDKYDGLKIPNSSIVEREVYKIDESYIAKNDDGDYFVKTVETSEDGTQETVEKPITYYRHEDTTYYVKADCFNDTDMIMKATGEDSKAVLSLERDTLQGVYIANEGVADFTEIQVKKTQDEFDLEEYKACARLAELANTPSGRAKLYDYFLKYDTTVDSMKKFGFSSVVSLVNQI